MRNHLTSDDRGNGRVEASDDAVRRGPESTRRRVLQGAYVVFGDHGIADSSLCAVALEAGVSEADIGACFADKDELVLALLEEHVLHRLSYAAECFLRAPIMEQAVDNMAEVLVEAMRIDATAHRLLAENFAITHHDPVRREAMAARRREAHHAVERVIIHLQGQTELPLKMSPEMTAVTLLALSNGLGIEASLNPDSVSTELLTTLVTSMILGP